MYIQPHQAHQTLVSSRKQDISAHLHNSIKLSELQATLDRLVILGMPKKQAKNLQDMAKALLQVLLEENDDIHRKASS